MAEFGVTTFSFRDVVAGTECHRSLKCFAVVPLQNLLSVCMFWKEFFKTSKLPPVLKRKLNSYSYEHMSKFHCNPNAKEKTSLEPTQRRTLRICLLQRKMVIQSLPDWMRKECLVGEQ